MNKIAKLPIFLGAVVAVCGTLLAGVYAFTNPIIEKANKEKAAQAYISLYQEFGVTGENVGEEIDVEDITSCTKKVEIINGSVKGVCYTCSTKGFGGTIDFLVAFGNGKYIGYTDLGNSETGSYGQIVIGAIGETIHGKEVANKLTDDAEYSALIAGKSVTGKALAAAIDNCAVDYANWYSVNK